MRSLNSTPVSGQEKVEKAFWDDALQRGSPT